MQFRVDFMNVLNNIHYQDHNIDITGANFGKVTAEDNTPRWIRSRFRLTFYSGFNFVRPVRRMTVREGD